MKKQLLYIYIKKIKKKKYMKYRDQKKKQKRNKKNNTTTRKFCSFNIYIYNLYIKKLINIII